MRKHKYNTTSPIILVILMTLLQGCATALLSQAPVTSKKVQYSIFSHDQIKAVGYPLEKGERVDGILLIGENYSYLVKRGQDRIELMMNNLSYEHVVLENKISLIKTDDKFHGHIRFEYEASGDYSPEEISALSKLCKSITQPGRWFGLGDPQTSYYDCEAFISGMIFSNHNITLENSIEFQEGRHIVLLVNDGTVDVIDSAKVSDKILALPFAVGFDIITAPLQIFLLPNRNK